MGASRRARAAVVVGSIGIDLLVWHGAVRTVLGTAVPTWLPVLALALAHQSLWLVGRRPRLVLGIQIALGSVSLVVPLWQPFAGLLTGTYAVSARRGARGVAGMLPAVLAVLVSHSYGSARLTAAPASSTAILLALWGALTAVVVAAGVRRHTLAAHGRQRVRLAQAQAQADLIEQRRRIAHDLHDGLGAAVTALHLHAWGGGAASGDGPLPARSVAAIRSGAQHTLVELRRVVGSLQPSSGPAGAALPAAPSPSREVARLARSARTLGMRVSLHGPWSELADDDLAPVAAEALVRTAQECLTNALKYAGAGACTLELRRGTAAVTLCVRSTTGRPPAVAPSPPDGWSGGGGLAGLAHRAALAGGRLRAGPTAGGFQVTLRVPTCVVLVP
ncbi:MAG: histidine kinase [Dermatophilaceae bacterium]